MKKISILFFLALLACGERASVEFDVVSRSVNPTQSEIYLSDQQTLNVFYDLALLDTCVVFADYFSDSLIQIRSIEEPACIVRNLYRGNGPDEFVTPYFDKSVRMKNQQLSLIDVNSGTFATIQLINGNVEINTERLPSDFPFCSSLNETDLYTYGVDIEQNNQGMFFIWDKQANRLLKRIEYNPEIKSNYKESSLPFLYLNDICVNEKAETIVAAMLNLNIVHFYDLKGKIKKTCMIGDKLLHPEAGGKFLDFPDSPKYFTHISGSEKYVYCLYNGTSKKNGSTEVFVFSWDGVCVERLKLDKPVHRIKVDNFDRYLLGIAENGEGGTDVIKYRLRVNL